MPSQLLGRMKAQWLEWALPLIWSFVIEVNYLPALGAWPFDNSGV